MNEPDEPTRLRNRKEMLVRDGGDGGSVWVRREVKGASPGGGSVH